MALIKCEDCGRDVSDQAESCPGCARPIRSRGSGTDPMRYVDLCQRCGGVAERVQESTGGCLSTVLLIGGVILLLVGLFSFWPALVGGAIVLGMRSVIANGGPKRTVVKCPRCRTTRAAA